MKISYILALSDTSASLETIDIWGRWYFTSNKEKP